ncbi:MAG: dihydroorotase [Haloarculaceae archaeon]
MLVTNAELADGRTADVRVSGESVAAVGALDPEEDEDVLDADGKLLLPGMIDVHVHFREPGSPEKETWSSGSRSAAAGGVTTVVDQPNADPPTVTGEAFDAKAELAAPSCVDYGLNGGVTPDWDPDSLFDRPLFALGEVFLADSTGNMGIEAELFESALRRATDEGVTVTVHAEDADRFDDSARERGDEDYDAWSAYRTPEAELAAVERACEVAGEVGARIHVAHTSTPEGVDAASGAGMTTEVTPHHLFLSREDLDELGTFGRMNPPLRDESRREALWERLVDGTVDMVATDHAPHTRLEKDTSVWDAPSGVPGVETALPLLLNAAREGEIGYERVRDATAANPAERFGLDRKGRIESGRDADLVLVDPEEPRPIHGPDLHSRCGWSPFEAFEGVFPEWTMLRGRFVYRQTGVDATGTGGRDGAFREGVGRNVRTPE